MNMTHISKIILFLILLNGQSSFAADEIIVGKGSSILSIKPSTASECNVTSIEQYKRFFLFKYDYDHNYYYLITQDVRAGEGCFEGNDPANIRLAAQKIHVRTGLVSDKSVWSFSTKGISGERAKYPLLGVYQITYPGCCGASDTIKYFSLSSGKLLGASSLKPLKLEIPNTRKVRYITVQDNNASDYMGGKAGAAAIFYSDEEDIKQELVIAISNPADAYCYLTRLKFKGKKDDEQTYLLWKHATFEDVSAIVELSCKDSILVVEIPVVDDRLSALKAAAKGFPTVKIEDITHKEAGQQMHQTGN